MTTSFTLPYRLKNVAAVYASSMSTLLSAYVYLPGHHLRSTLDLITTPPTSTDPEEISLDEGAWAGVDFSDLSDLEMLLRFLEASNYCFGYSDSDGDDYDRSQECFDLEADITTPLFSTVSQNVMAIMLLLIVMPEPSMLEGRRVR